MWEARLHPGDRTLEGVIPKGQAGSRQKKIRRQGILHGAQKVRAPGGEGLGWQDQGEKQGVQPGLGRCLGSSAEASSDGAANECTNALRLLSVCKHFPGVFKP